MNTIYVLVDYKNRFGSKKNDVPYRSGMDRLRLAECARQLGFELRYVAFADLDFRKLPFGAAPILYMSSEDHSLLYKDYIEDVLLGLHLKGFWLVPSFYFFRAHHNKVFMEILRDLIGGDEIKNIRSKGFGTYEEFERRLEEISGPVVLKAAASVMSGGVVLARDAAAKRRIARRLSASRNLWVDLWDIGRWIRRRGYVRDSRHRRKFIAQTFVEGLGNDWKVLIYGKRAFVLKRENRPGDFRASGSGRFIFEREIPPGMLDYAKRVADAFDVPQLSLDIGYQDGEFFLLEFQALHFGTTTLVLSPFHFEKTAQGSWMTVEGPAELEQVFAESIIDYVVSHRASRQRQQKLFEIASATSG